MNEQDQRIREFAYEIWQTEGCPEGQGERHWEMARKLVEAQDSGIPLSKPNSKPRKSTIKPTDVTSASSLQAPGAEAEQPLPEIKPAKAAKPGKTAAAAKGKAKPSATEAAEGTPAGVKKTRAPRTKKDS
jgi:hypothetical protein